MLENFCECSHVVVIQIDFIRTDIYLDNIGKIKLRAI